MIAACHSLNRRHQREPTDVPSEPGRRAWAPPRRVNSNDPRATDRSPGAGRQKEEKGKNMSGMTRRHDGCYRVAWDWQTRVHTRQPTLFTFIDRERGNKDGIPHVQ
jgi:hypothetical protein